jgi:hypothetical protein
MDPLFNINCNLNILFEIGDSRDNLLEIELFKRNLQYIRYLSAYFVHYSFDFEN